MFGSEQYTKKVGNVCAHDPQDWKKLDPEILESRTWETFFHTGRYYLGRSSDNAVRFQSTLFCIIIP